MQNTNLKPEFAKNFKPKDIEKAALTDYLNSFRAIDSFQGFLGDCFLISAIMSILRNKRLLEIVIPIDNSFENNMKIGAYHFKFWNYDKWCDVVVDDYLPTTNSNHLLFCHNQEFPNLFWPSLLEKAFAK